MNDDLINAINWDAIDPDVIAAVLNEDRTDAEVHMDLLSRPRSGVRFIPIVEADEIVEGAAAPPRPKTIATTVNAYHEQIGIYGADHVIIVAPYKDKPAGVKELNDAIRASLGYGPGPSVGDFLMCMKNSLDRSRLNGERYRGSGRWKRLGIC